MASPNPYHRDRGLRLVGVLTVAVAALSLVAVGATTSLAADETIRHDAVKAAAEQPTPTPTAKATKRHKKSTSRSSSRARSVVEGSEPGAATTPKQKVKPKPAAPVVEETTAPPAVTSSGS